jgi:hypothetical protein
VLVGVLGVGALIFIRQHQEVKRLGTENVRLRVELLKGEKERRPAMASSPRAIEADLNRLRVQIAELTKNPAGSWQERANALRHLLEQHPELGIPELQLATDADWLDAAKGKLDTEEDFRRALAAVRFIVTARFAGELRPALNRYLDGNGGQFPTDISSLQPYLNNSAEGSFLPHYQIVSASALPNMKMGGAFAITQTGPVDEDYDMLVVIGPTGYGSTTFSSEAMVATMAPVIQAFKAANPGQTAADPSQLLPYATTPEQAAALQKAIAHSK